MSSTPRLLAKVFGLALAAGIAGVLGLTGVEHYRETRRAAEPVRIPVATQELADGIWVAGQIEIADLDHLRSRGFKRIIDLRPDGEAANQPSSAEMGATTRNHAMDFAYVPVPQGEMPDRVADDLAAALGAGSGPVLLYCRSGRRAARAWALAESSRAGGMSPDEIETRVKAVGQATDDIADRLRARATTRAMLN